MTCEVKIIEDSISPYTGVRLTTFQLRYWRAIHSEFMTHRVFSRSASSSRAIPVQKMLSQVWNEPAMPVHWGMNQAGMQANAELSGIKLKLMKSLWNTAGKTMCTFAYLGMKLGAHKQLVNRILEPWQYISVVMTTTELDNFFMLRDHKDAQPEIQELARHMKWEYDLSVPKRRLHHLPYVTDGEYLAHSPETCMKLSTARCARVSYLTHDGKAPSFDNDMVLYDRLVGSVPIHASPAEHPAEAAVKEGYIKNFNSWIQHRVEVEETVASKQ